MKNEIAEVLRRTAKRIPQNKSEWAGGHKESQYICDNLHAEPGEESGPYRGARMFLIRLGMGSGSGVFGPHMKTCTPDQEFEDRQSQRIAWLLFAADIAEEWGVT